MHNNGVFLNLTRLPEDVICKIEKYVAYCTHSRNELQKCEDRQKNLNQELLAGAPEEEVSSVKKGVAALDETASSAASLARRFRNTGAMRFQLLKKRFMKTNAGLAASGAMDDDIFKENYVM